MLAEDIQPTRLERATHKIRDLLALRPGARTALIAYAGSAHLVMPLTTDARLIEEFAGELSPGLMPRPGNAPAEALTLATQLLQQDDAGGGSISVDHRFIAAGCVATLPAGVRAEILAVAAPPGSPGAGCRGRLRRRWIGRPWGQRPGRWMAGLVEVSVDDSRCADTGATIGETRLASAGTDGRGRTLARCRLHSAVSAGADPVAVVPARLGGKVAGMSCGSRVQVCAGRLARCPADGCRCRCAQRVRIGRSAPDGGGISGERPDQQAQRLFDAGDYAGAASRSPIRCASARHGFAPANSNVRPRPSVNSPRSKVSSIAPTRCCSRVSTSRRLPPMSRCLPSVPIGRPRLENRAIALARKERLAPPEDDAGGTGGMLRPTRSCSIPPAGRTTPRVNRPPRAVRRSDAAMREMWLRRVETRPADFLRARFASQLQRRQEGGQ